MDGLPPAASPALPCASLAGAAFVVIGAGGGVGREVVRQLAARDARLVLAGRDPGRLAAAAELARHPVVMEVDATDFAAVEACLQRGRELGDGRLAGVALCVGSIVLKPIQSTSAAEWQQVLDTNLTTAFAVVRAAAKTMRDGGSVVLCSSAAASVGPGEIRHVDGGLAHVRPVGRT